MKLFTSKEDKKILACLSILLLAAIFCNQIIVKKITDDYKNTLLEHDYKLAGYLHQKGINTSLIVEAFSSEKQDTDFKIGQELLKNTGYNSNLHHNLIPEVKQFYQNYSIGMFLFMSVIAVLILALYLFHVIRLNKKLEKAIYNINSFLYDKSKIDLYDMEEGSLSQLFYFIQEMATSLTTHISKEKNSKEFLKDMISDISHQIKTPLSSLLMYNEIILNENADNEIVSRFSNKSREELERMENLILTLLKLARLDAGEIDLDVKAHNLKGLLEDVVYSFSVRAQTENKEIILSCSENLAFSCDEKWLFEGLSNIIKNALDHTGSESKIIISCYKTPVALSILIKDNGTGIHPDDIHSIFKRFYRSRFSKDKQGIGIGLTLSKSVIEKHGGTITVESEYGKGTSFLLSFPKLTNL